MSEYVFVLVAILATAAVVEIVLKRLGFGIKTAGIVSIVAIVSCLILSIFLSYNFYNLQEPASFLYFSEWITSWGIDFTISIDGITATLIPIVFLTLTFCIVLSRAEEKDGLYYFLIMFLITSLVGFCLSYNFVLKIIFWEACWIPIFFIILNENKKNIAMLFSKTWFISELFLVTGSIIAYNHLSTNIGSKQILQLDQTSVLVTNLIFWLFIITVSIRAMIFPLDKLVDKITKECSAGFSIIVVSTLPLLPIIFLIQVVLPSFPVQVSQYGFTLYFIFLGLGLFRILKSIKDKSLSSIINSQIIVFNAILVGFTLRLNQGSLEAVMELISLKLILNVVIIFCGIEAIRRGLNTKKLYFWLMMASLVMSFGLIEVLFSKQSFSGLYSLLLILLLLFITSIRISRATGQKTEAVGNGGIYPSIVLVVAMILVLSALCISIFPEPIQSFSSTYYKSVLEVIQ